MMTAILPLKSRNRRARISGRLNRLLGHIEIQLMQPALVIIAGKIQRQMRMRVHESWRKRRIAEIDHPRAIRNG